MHVHTWAEWERVVLSQQRCQLDCEESSTGGWRLQLSFCRQESSDTLVGTQLLLSLWQQSIHSQGAGWSRYYCRKRLSDILGKRHSILWQWCGTDWTRKPILFVTNNNHPLNLLLCRQPPSILPKTTFYIQTIPTPPALLIANKDIPIEQALTTLCLVFIQNKIKGKRKRILKDSVEYSVLGCCYVRCCCACDVCVCACVCVWERVCVCVWW